MKSNQPIYEWHPPKRTSMILATFVDGYLLPRSTKEQKVIRNMTYPSIIFHISDWGRNFLQKIGNIFPHYVVALSSCNTRFEKEKWELSQLGYSGEMQLLQKDFDMEKTYVDADWANKTYTEYRKAYQSSMLIQDVPLLRISIIKHIWAIFIQITNILDPKKKHIWMLFRQKKKHLQNGVKHTSHWGWSRMYHFWDFWIIQHIWAIFIFVLNYKHSECSLGRQNILKTYQPSILI